MKLVLTIAIVVGTVLMDKYFLFQFNEPGGLFAISNLLYVADTNNHCIKVINLDDYSVEIVSI